MRGINMKLCLNCAETRIWMQAEIDSLRQRLVENDRDWRTVVAALELKLSEICPLPEIQDDYEEHA